MKSLKYILPIIAYCATFIQLNKVSNNIFIKIFQLGLLVYLSIKYHSGINKKIKIKNSSIILIFILVELFSIFRSSSQNSELENIFFSSINFSLTAWFIYISLQYFFLIEDLGMIEVLDIVIIKPATIYMVLNFIFYILDISFIKIEAVEELGTCLFLEKIGININRVLFPLSGGGLNTFAALIGVFWTTGLTLFLVGYRRINILLLIALSLITLLLTDSRSFIINGILSSIIISLMYRSKYINIAKYFPWLIILLPIIYMLVLPFIYSTLLNGLKRDDESKESLLRIAVWAISILFLLKFDLMSIIGYGEYGHYASGVSKKWASLFYKWSNPEYITPHSTLFSTIFDTGYIGLIILFILIKKTIANSVEIKKVNLKFSIYLGSIVLYYILSSTSDSLNGFYSPGMIFLILIIASLSHIYKKNSEDIQSKNVEFIQA